MYDNIILSCGLSKNVVRHLVFCAKNYMKTFCPLYEYCYFVVNLSDVFHNGKELEKKIYNIHKPAEKINRPKFAIGNPEAFAKSREVLGNIIVTDMKTSGGMDVDWVVERRGNFIILEIKTFHDDRIRISLGQMIAYGSLYKRLNENGKCYLYVIGVDENDFTNDDSSVWIFEMKEWLDNKIPHIARSFEENDLAKEGFVVERSFMHEISVHQLRELLENAWAEFGR